MTFSEWSNQKKKKEQEEGSKTARTMDADIAKFETFSEWSNNKYGVEDIAPVKTTIKTPTKTTTDEDKRTWFETGAFEDGYQVGDVVKTILGTERDFRENLLAGAYGIVEKTIDAGAYLVGGVGGLFGADEFKEKTAGFIKKDLIDEEKIAKFGAKFTDSKIQRLILRGSDADDMSMLGEKSDSLVQSGGQLAATMALQSVGVPWYLTSGVTSFGAEAENALNQGATYGQAGLSAAITAGAEILTEKLFGGSGLGETGLINVEALTSGIAKKGLKLLLDYGIDVVGEGAEEAVSQFFSNLGTALYKEDSLKDILFSEEALDGYLESAIGGGVLGGVMNASNVHNSIKNGTDYRTGLTANEQKVIDKEIENRIAEQEKDGKKLTKKEKAAIEEAVIRDMEKGLISTDTIEEVLGGEEYTAYKGEYDAFFGGDTYKAYKDTVESEEAQIAELKEQIKALENEPNTIGNSKKYDALQSQIEQLENSEARAKLKAQLDSEAARIGGIKNQLRTNVSEMVKGDRLAESYNELIRKEQKFVPDFDKFKGVKHEEAARKTLESAVNAGFDNTNKSRGLVELAAKTAGDKGLTYAFMTGEQIKEDFVARQTEIISKFEAIADPTPEQVEEIARLKDELAKVQSGKTTVNGYITKDGAIALSMDAEMPLNRVVGHEVMHSVEQTKHGRKMKDVLFAYAKSRGEDIDSMLEDRKRLYEGIENADPEAELVADLVGKYLFSDADFVNHLSVTDRNVFQKIYDEIKYLCKVATAGSKEARELERVKKLFEDAYRTTKTTANDSSVKYHASPSLKNPKYLDPKTVTKQDVYNALEGIATGEYNDNSYVPIRISTPGIVQERLFTRDLPMAMPVHKIAQAMREDQGAIEGKNVRGHGFTASDIISIIEKMDSPEHLFIQPSNNRGVAVVSHEASGEETAVIVEFDCNINPAYLNGYEGGTYNLAISPFNVDGGMVGLFEYAKKNHWTEVFNKAKEGDPAKKFPATRPFAVEQGSLAEILPSGEPTVKKQYSLSNADTNKSYLAAVEQGDMDTARTIMEKVAKRRGYTIHAYHGTARGDRVGNVFLPERATSGPMAFFTDNKEIAENYSKSKQDTSMAYDPDYDRYETQFRIKAGTLDIPLYRAWGYLPFDARRRITEKAGQLRENWDGDNELILDPETNEANGGFQWQLKEARGNAIQALTEQWLNSGNLFNDEARFLDVLEMAGVTEEFKKIKGMGELYFKDPNAKHEKVYDTFLKIKNPFETANVDEQFIADLEAWYEEQDQDKYVRENMQSDLWDKNGIDAYDFAERLRSDIEKNSTHAWTSIPDSVTDYLKHLGYDGIKDTGGKYGGDIHTVWIPFSSEQVKSAETVTYDDAGNVIPITDRFDKKEVDIRRSLSRKGDQFAPLTSFDVFGRDLKLGTNDALAPFQTKSTEEVAPIQEEAVAENAMTTEQMFPDDAYAPIADDPTRFDSLDDADAPPERVVESGEHSSTMTMPKSTVNMIAQNVKASLWVGDRQIGDVRRLIEEYASQEFPNREWLFEELKDNYGKHTEKIEDDITKEVKSELRKYRLNVSDAIKSEIPDYNDLRRRNFGKVLFSRQGTAVDVAYEELSNMYPSHFPRDIITPTDQLLQIIDVANMSGATEQTYELDDETVWDVVSDIAEAVSDYQYIQKERDARKMPEGYMDDLVKHGDEYAPMMPPNRPVFDAPVRADAPTYDAQPGKGVADGQQTMFEQEPVTEEERKQTRKQLHQSIVDGIKETFKAKGFDFDAVLKKAKNLSTFATVDNMPQRVMEKALGYKEGQVLSDITVNKVAQNETEGIKWLNSYTDRKNGLLKKISDQYHIKPGSKESAAAQMYAEGFYVAENNDIIAYGDAELAKDFPDVKVQQNIKRLARDPRIRRIYDETLAMINESRARNAYPEIQKLDNYFLHFRAMDDTFSKLGLPFNPNDIRAKDLPTDLNGVTADLKPGQPYFASAMHRTGKRTSFDLLGGLERYLTSAKNQIYHIDDIQTLRALRNYIADTYGQANGLEGLDVLSEEEAQQRIEQVYNSHLSTFAKFLNEEANILAGKTALIDRGLEGILGRRGMTFLDTVNKQVGSNMVGFNISSSLTNFLPVAQTFAKTNKFDFVKAFAQTVGNKVGGVFGRTDGFAENSPVIIRRKGADRFYRTPWQKAGDAGYVFMSAVDDISTELIARTKYNELTRNGMDAQTAHYETDKWVSRLMGDRSLGQMPQIYNSKMLGLVTKFQLEVRNQLDSQFYDTIQEAKVSNEHIQNGLARNAKIAAKCASTFVQLAVAQHLFGKAFESIAGYNPAFDIISVLMTAFGFDDDDDSEDTALDNIEQAFLELLEDLPYTSTFTGGRIPISSAMPITELVKGVDEWGNDKSRWETLGEIAPYYLMPGGYGQAKKTVQGLSMFSDDHPIAGSYTDSGNLRFPVEDTFGNRIQAGIFGQWANENARDYFKNGRSPLKAKQIQEFMDVDIPIHDYWEYREGLSGLDTLNEKADYIAGLDLPIDKKNLLLNNIADRDEKIDLTGYEDFGDFEEFDYAVKNPEKYKIAEQVGGFEAYMEYQEGMKGMKLAEKADYIAGLDLSDAQKNALINGETDRKEPIDMTGYDPSVYSSFEEFEFAKDSPETYAVAKAVGGYDAYKGYSSELYDIKADKDQYGKSISGSRKAKVLDYINNLDADYYTKIILWKSEYTSDDSYNYEIIEYLNGRDDISFEEEIAILRKLGFKVTDDGSISW